MLMLLKSHLIRRRRMEIIVMKIVVNLKGPEVREVIEVEGIITLNLMILIEPSKDTDLTFVIEVCVFVQYTCRKCFGLHIVL